MRDKANIEQALKLNPDYLGFIFYDKSPRFVGSQLDCKQLMRFPSTTKKVGVFVDKNLNEVLKQVQKFGLDYVQLHGEETPEYVAELFALGIKTIKAFGVDEDFDFGSLSAYHPFVDFFLFDTKSKQKGGTGRKFDWNLLQAYDQKVPFFLSGGISPNDISALKAMKGINIYAIDVNSRFEVEPGLKDIEELKRLRELL